MKWSALILLNISHTKSTVGTRVAGWASTYLYVNIYNIHIITPIRNNVHAVVAH